MATTESPLDRVEYPSLLETLEKELAQDPNKLLTVFCQEHSLDYRGFNEWLRATGRSFLQIRSRIRASCGLPATPNERYLECFNLLKAELNENIRLGFVDFCERHEVSYRGMRNWLESNNLDFATMRARIWEAKGEGIPPHPYIPISAITDKAQIRFSKTLDTYREELSSNSRYSLRTHCGRMGTDYFSMLRWMKFMKISATQLQKAARLKAKLPPNPSMVMVQFRPNGGTRSDKFRGVTITCPDGKIIRVEECSVIELCTFLYTYDKDQRRKSAHV